MSSVLFGFVSFVARRLVPRVLRGETVGRDPGSALWVVCAVRNVARWRGVALAGGGEPDVKLNLKREGPRPMFHQRAGIEPPISVSTLR